MYIGNGITVVKNKREKGNENEYRRKEDQTTKLSIAHTKGINLYISIQF